MTNVKCSRCGVVNLLSNEVCKVCGADLQPSFHYPAPQPEMPGYETETGHRENQPFIPPMSGVGNVLGPTLSLFTKNFWLITKIVFVIFAPFEVFKALSVDKSGIDWQLQAGLLALQLLCTALVAPALLYALLRLIETGEAPGVNESYRWSLNKLPKLIPVALLSWILIALASLLLIIPGIVLALSFAVVYPVAVFEKCSVTGTLGRSYDLTDGHRWNILGATFVIGIVASLGTIPASAVVLILAFNGVSFWLVEAAAAIVADIASQLSTVLALVLYISLLRTLESGHSVIK